MSKFDHADFTANQGKYRLFKTATVRNSIINQDGHVDAGTIVGLEFLGVVRNQMYRRDEPVYRLTTGDTCYANNLTDFCL